MARAPELSPNAMTAEQRIVYDAIASGPRGKVEGPLRVWLHSPPLAERAQELGAFCRYHSTLEPRLSELAILVTGATWRAGFEWYVHAPIGIAAGLDPSAVEAIRIGAEPDLVRDDEIAVHRFAKELWSTKTVSDDTYNLAERALGARGVVELVGILGYYSLISMTINAFKVEVPESCADPFHDLAGRDGASPSK